MPTLSDIQKKVVTVKIRFYDITGEVKYYPGIVNEELLEKIRDADSFLDELTEEQIEKLGEPTGNDILLAIMVESWDLEDNEGPVPIRTGKKIADIPQPHPKLVKIVPMAYKAAVIAQITEDIEGNLTSSRRSSGARSRRRGK